MNKWLMVGIIPLGMIPGLLNLSWAWVVIVFWLWFLVDPSRFSQNLNKLTVILFYIYFVFCCWGIAQSIGMPFIHQYQNYLYGIVLIFFLSFWGNLLFNQQWKTIWNHSQVMIALSLMTIVLILIHAVLCMWSGMIMETNRWNAYFVSLVLIMTCLLPFHASHPFCGFPRKLKPLFVVMMAVVLFGQYCQFVQLRNAAHDSTQYRAAAASAMKAGYIQIAVDAVLNEGAKLASQGKMDEAVRYMRSQWEHLPKEPLAKQYREHHLTIENPFLFLSTYGGRLRLSNDEEIVDGVLIHEPLQYLVVTNQNRVLEITPNGIKKHPILVKEILRIHFEPAQQTIYGVTKNSLVFIHQDNTMLYVQLPPEQLWEDVVLSSSGERMWALNSRGGIMEYGLIDREWKPARELYPPLWRESDLAIRLLHETFDGHDVFYVLDEYKGLSLRCPASVQDQLLPKEDLFRFYHPDRRIAVDAQRYEDKIIITDQFGQLDMVEKDIGSDFTEWKYSIRGTINFDRNSSMWQQQDNTVALMAYPEASTLIQLKRNGVFEPIVMPQGFRIVPLKRNGWWDVPINDDLKAIIF